MSAPAAMAATDAPLLEVRGLTTRFHSFGGTVTAVDGVSLSLARGEILGLVGESGGGKSVVGFSIMGLIDPPGRIEGGQVLLEGTDLLALSEPAMRRVRGGRIGMIFQDPMTSLNPVQTIGWQMDEMLRLHTSLGARQRRARCIAMLRDVGISRPESRLGQYPHQFSGGMRQRVVIAIAMLAQPALLIADEPTTALDVTIQAQILALIGERVRREGASMILITHDLAVIARMADSIAVLYCGRVVERGAKRGVIREPAHPYTLGLIGSIPRPGERQERLTQTPGTVPDMRALPPGCAFAARCPRADARCLAEPPALRQVRPGRHAACHHPLPEGLA